VRAPSSQRARSRNDSCKSNHLGVDSIRRVSNCHNGRNFSRDLQLRHIKDLRRHWIATSAGIKISRKTIAYRLFIDFTGISAQSREGNKNPKPRAAAFFLHVKHIDL
jgi:hypothetical protein